MDMLTKNREEFFMEKNLFKLVGGGGNARITSHNQGFSLIKAFNNLAPWGEKKFVSELKRTYKFQRGVNNKLDCHANQTRILSKEYSFVAGDYVRSTARNDVKRHAEDNSPKYRMVCNDVGLESPTYRNNCGEYRKTVITRSDKRRSNRIHIEKDEIATFRYTPLAMTDKRLRNKCAMTCDLFPRPFGERVRERGYLAASLFSRLAAFTLAEVLITLGIIGVVSAMTVPTLMQNYQRQSYVTQLHKVYNEMSQALLRYQTDKNAVNLREAGLTSANAVNSFITTYLKVVKDCGNDFSACFGSDYKKINGTSLSFGEASSAAGVFVLAGGQSIAIFSRNSDSQQYSNSIATILVDVNGKKGPNIQGRDFYQMDIYSTDGGPVIDEMIWNVTQQPPFTEAQRNTQFNSYCVAGGSGNFHGCFGKILNDNWQMNY